jgi:hypothetical protein
MTGAAGFGCPCLFSVVVMVGKSSINPRLLSMLWPAGVPHLCIVNSDKIIFKTKSDDKF